MTNLMDKIQSLQKGQKLNQLIDKVRQEKDCFQTNQSDEDQNSRNDTASLLFINERDIIVLYIDTNISIDIYFNEIIIQEEELSENKQESEV
ncbi:unnamed protein product (macronuclear) [Paramecium tetraurelia]|uniref:Uncharacterized protein n=1 Tax=Paramecium tetraurelia TaxID=5888 RepID=A0BSU3_PARTE|nr:uncharacterized protein GSPATT00031842001 [Paramecium tetraurelia]CAK61610.1 unnamed protein product [Paramecium tetraurelia]|eukprot:XP_001429008.1 hypothetical protein (macronuclear) [Paramecium tetraurelia strain d4-2]